MSRVEFKPIGEWCFYDTLSKDYFKADLFKVVSLIREDDAFMKEHGYYIHFEPSMFRYEPCMLIVYNLNDPNQNPDTFIDLDDDEYLKEFHNYMQRMYDITKGSKLREFIFNDRKRQFYTNSVEEKEGECLEEFYGYTQRKEKEDGQK